MNKMTLEEKIKEIREKAASRHALILAHYYTRPEIQEVADFIGDSLALARKAAETDAPVLVMCGVHFMAETCKLLSPEKTVLEPDPAAGCSLADSCRAEDLKAFKEAHPGYKVISYVNTTAAVKALSDCCVTSGNAVKVINSLPKDEKLIFGPDYNLGNYINAISGREMLLWQGGCHVHEKFSVQAILKLKRQYPDALVMAHLECKAPVLALADVKGSTAAMLTYAQSHPGQKQFIEATEAGILFEMRRRCPDQTFIPVPPEVTEGENLTPAESGQGLTTGGSGQGSAAGHTGDKDAAAQDLRIVTGMPAACACNECEFMKLNTLEKIAACLDTLQPQVTIPEDIAREAVKPIEKMLSLS